ncbi:MAG: UDP-N-acetylmuramoyl-L-alanyl-D-glutamate--2,6-diaminopimelate ligase [Vulcanimicrobiota bacterium]
MKLEQLLSTLSGAEIRGNTESEIFSLAYDSRQAQEGCLFFCITGFKMDGHAFAGDAVARGARALCVERDVEVPEGIAVIKVPDTRCALAAMSACFYDYPSRKLKMIGVTGTNGKTTTTTLISEVMNRSGIKTGLIGTLFIQIGDIVRTSRVTTPESLDLQSILADMVSHGMEAVVMEVSSHALSLGRTSGVSFDRAVFTNLTQDHLDFHHSIDEYFNAKLMLFKELGQESGQELGQGPGMKPGAMAVLNSDDNRTKEILACLSTPSLTYGTIDSNADFRAEDLSLGSGGAAFRLRTPEGEYPVSLSMTGTFNVYNALAALATLSTMGLEMSGCIRLAEEFHGVKGRFQMVRQGQDFAVIVDYAHTPDGLENILHAAREITSGTLVTVFGCGGDRDRTKRPLMGGIAARLSDVVIVTSDNPRTEDPEKIISDIEEGILPEKKDYEKVVDRKSAIWKALDLGKKGDTVVIAGKGHENYQIFKDRTIHFDDVEVVQEYFASKISSLSIKGGQL